MMKLSISMTPDENKMGWLFLSIQLIFLPRLLTAINALLEQPMSLALLNFLMFAINFLLAVLIFHRFLWQSLKTAIRSPIRLLRPAFLGFVFYYLADLVMRELIQAVCPDFSNLNDQSIISMTQDHYALMAIGTVILVPVVEELLYRGLIFGSLQKKSRIVAYLVSVPVFCMIHIVNFIGVYTPIQLALSFLQYVPAGICLAWAYERADSIWAPILMHTAINQIAISFSR